MFQSSSGQKAGCNVIERNAGGLALLFQSSSGQKAGCNRIPSEPRLLAPMFQSSSGQKAGCNHRKKKLAPTVKPIRGFNPHPARRPDATRVFEADGGVRMLVHVSILIRLEGRMQRGTPSMGTIAMLVGSFNPHPARRPDATCPSPPTVPSTPGFQSSSGLLAGCNLPVSATCSINSWVSILIQPEGRMQPARLRQLFHQLLGFNPHPAFWPDATCPSPPPVPSTPGFQSSSSQKAGCNGCCKLSTLNM